MKKVTASSAHTAEPWNLGTSEMSSAEGTKRGFYVFSLSAQQRIAHLPVENGNNELQGANARRIVSCINACAGLNPEAFPELLRACKEAVKHLSIIKPAGGDAFVAMQDAISKAEDSRNLAV